MEELVHNTRTFLKSADLVYSTNYYASATTLYFKVLFVVIDYLLLTSIGQTPKDHTQRFRMVEKSHPELYTFLDKYFQIYRNTYTLSISEKQCIEVRKHVHDIITRYKIPLSD